MYDLIEERISTLHLLQLDLMQDCNSPVPLSEVAYYREMAHEGEEMPAEMAAYLAQEVLAYAKAYAAKHDLYIATCQDAPCKGYAMITLSRQGDEEAGATICYKNSCINSEHIVFKGLWESYGRKLLFI